MMIMWNQTNHWNMYCIFGTCSEEHLAVAYDSTTKFCTKYSKCVSYTWCRGQIATTSDHQPRFVGFAEFEMDGRAFTGGEMDRMMMRLCRWIWMDLWKMNEHEGTCGKVTTFSVKFPLQGLHGHAQIFCTVWTWKSAARITANDTRVCANTCAVTAVYLMFLMFEYI